MAILVILINILIGAVLLAYILYKKVFGYWKSRGVPFIKPVFPYGNSKGLGTEFHTFELMKRVYNELKDKGPFGGILISFRPTAIITDLDLIKNVLVKDFHFFQNRGIYYNPKDDPISEHLSNIENEQWKDIRSKLTLAFTSGKLRTMFETIFEISGNLMTTIEEESKSRGSLEIKNIMARFTCDVIGNVAFGIDCDCLHDKNAKFFDMAIKSMDSFDFVKRLVLMGYKTIARAFHMILTPTDVSEFYSHVVKSILENRNANKDVHRLDLMNILINMMKNGQLTMNQVAAHSFFYFVAGYETTSTTLTFCIYELSQNQDLQERARKEVLATLSRNENQLTYKAIDELNFLDQIVRETLRKWPPSVSVQREAADDYEVPNTKFVIEKGCAIMIPVYGIHHDESIYPEPENFDPTRFDADKVEERHPFAFLPFGDGPRACPGIRFSMLETKICMAKLLMSYQFSMDYDLTENPVKISPSKFMMSPEKGVFVQFNKIGLCSKL